MDYDVLVIGGGVVGASVIYQLARYDIKVGLLEAENDVAMGTTKANSAIIHAGYDPEPDTLMAKLNVLGNKMSTEICQKLNVEFNQIGSLVLAFTDSEVSTLKELYERGIANGVPNMELWDAKQTIEREPNLSHEVKGALYAPTAAVVSPWEMTLAMAEVAIKNGADVHCRAKVVGISFGDGRYTVDTTKGTFTAKYIFNAAGIFADDVHNLLEKVDWYTKPSKGEYFLMDKSLGSIVGHVVFQCPNENGKGILVSPTVHGNLIVGPSASPAADRHDLGNDSNWLNFVKEKALLSVPTLSWRDNIRNFTGLRANTNRADFIMEESVAFPGFFDLAGIKSPGLTSAPAIGVWAADRIKEKITDLKEKPNFDDTREKIVFNHLTAAEKEALIKKDPSYGRVICRCETITEGEIIAALKGAIVPRSLNAIKRRCGTGMGRCQSGFCGPRVQAIIARELDIPLEDVCLEEDGSYLLVEQTKLAAKGGK